MIIFILILGFGSLVQFAPAYCRTLPLAYSKVEVSEKAYAMAGRTAQEVNYDDFDRLIRLAEVEAAFRRRFGRIATVRVYYLAMPCDGSRRRSRPVWRRWRSASSVLAPIPQLSPSIAV